MNIPHKKLRDAVSSLILSHPFFAGVLIQQKFVEDNSEANPTFAVDGEHFFYNSAFADSLTFDECKGVAAHEASHLAGLHHTRQGSREIEPWNEAADLAINPRLIRDGFKLPAGALNEARFADMSAEDIYRIRERERKQQPQPSQGNGNGQPSPQGQQGNAQGNGKPQSGQQGNQTGNGKPSGAPSCGQVRKATGKDSKAVEAKTRSQIAQAIAISKTAGAMSANGERQIKRDLAPRFDWREVLHRFFQEITASDYSFATPNKRFAHTGVILPSLRSRSVGRIVLAVDTSGSVSVAEVSAMVAEMQACLEAYAQDGIAMPLTVIYCDASICGVETLHSGDTPNPKGGGGTCFAPVFEHLRGDLDGAACLVYLTDGYCSESTEQLAKLAPPFPVLWGLIRDNETFAQSVPFGECVKVDVAA